jgi:beta-lactamase regulating signal transducer with metallopeptidase domain
MRSELLRFVLGLTLASSLAIITALALRSLTRRMFGASVSYSLWLLVPVAMLCALLPHLRASSTTAPISALPETTFPLPHAVGRSFDSLATLASAPIDGELWILAGWAVGAAIFALYLGALQRAFVKSLGTLSGLRCVLRAEHSVGCPALIGVLRPKVILPADFRARYTRLERLLVLSHERTHLRRGDAGWNALVALMRCIFWFNPLIHVAARYFRFDQELACDAAVLRTRRGSRRPYASAMLKTQLTEGALPIGCHWRSAQDLKERLRMVGRAVPTRRRRLFGGALTTLMAVVVAYTAWAAEPEAGSTTTLAASAATRDQSVLGWTAAWAGWLTLPDQAPDQPVTIVMRDARLFLASGATRQIRADSARSGPTTALVPGPVKNWNLEGHVRLTFTGTNDGRAVPETTILETDKADLTEQTDGTAVLQVDEASLQMVMPPQFVYPGAPQILPELLTPNSLTINFRDADISQVAAAVQLATHRTISVDARVRAQLNMRSTMPVTPEGFYQAFLDILRTRGFVAVPDGPTGNAIRILPGPDGESAGLRVMESEPQPMTAAGSGPRRDRPRPT